MGRAQAALFSPRPRRLLALLLCSLLLVPASGQPRPSRPLVVSFIDIGQGDSTLIQIPSGRNILIDTGPPAGRRALFDCLRLRRVRRLDLLVLLHPHLDRYGNARQVLQRIPTRAVLGSGLVIGRAHQADDEWTRRRDHRSGQIAGGKQSFQRRSKGYGASDGKSAILRGAHRMSERGSRALEVEPATASKERCPASARSHAFSTPDKQSARAWLLVFRLFLPVPYPI